MASKGLGSALWGWTGRVNCLGVLYGMYFLVCLFALWLELWRYFMVFNMKKNESMLKRTCTLFIKPWFDWTLCRLFTMDRPIQCFYLRIYPFVCGAAQCFVSESHVWKEDFFMFTNNQAGSNIHSVLMWMFSWLGINSEALPIYKLWINLLVSPVLLLGVLSVLSEDLCMCRFSLSENLLCFIC